MHESVTLDEIFKLPSLKMFNKINMLRLKTIL